LGFGELNMVPIAYYDQLILLAAVMIHSARSYSRQRLSKIFDILQSTPTYRSAMNTMMHRCAGTLIAGA
jgi:hypothetical protein